MVCAEANMVTIKLKRMRQVFFIVLGWLINSLGAKILIFVTKGRKIGLGMHFFCIVSENKTIKNVVSSKNFLFLCR